MFWPVCPAAELWSGELRAAKVGGVALVVLRVGDEVRAYEDRCAHLGAPLSDGTLDGAMITCAAHHWQYDAMTGQGTNPAHVCLRRFATRLEDGVIWVDPEAG